MGRSILHLLGWNFRRIHIVFDAIPGSTVFDFSVGKRGGTWTDCRCIRCSTAAGYLSMQVDAKGTTAAANNENATNNVQRK